jgi:hypothetical protein
MTLADIIILVIVILIVGFIIYSMVRKKDEGICSRCAYNKNCNDECFPNKKTIR